MAVTLRWAPLALGLLAGGLDWPGSIYDKGVVCHELPSLVRAGVASVLPTGAEPSLLAVWCHLSLEASGAVLNRELCAKPKSVQSSLPVALFGWACA
jgi:hypothetical protein